MFSPQKRLLEEFTPAKIMVGCDINGWLETNQKKQYSIIKKNIRVRPPRPEALVKGTVTNFNALKRKIYNLDNFDEFSEIKNSKNFVPSTQATSPGVGLTENRYKLNEMRAKFENIIKISSFDEKLKEVEKASKSSRPLIRIQQVKNNGCMYLPDPSLKEQKSKRMTKILSYNQIKNKSETYSVKDNGTKITSSLMIKKDIVSHSVGIVKGKLSTNQYKALNMIVRKTQNVQIKNPLFIYNKIKIYT